MELRETGRIRSNLIRWIQAVPCDSYIVSRGSLNLAVNTAGLFQSFVIPRNWRESPKLIKRSSAEAQQKVEVKLEIQSRAETRQIFFPSQNIPPSSAGRTGRII